MLERGGERVVPRNIAGALVRCAVMLAAAALACALPRSAPAHDIPNDVKVQMFVKPSGEKLQLLVRVPLAAMREVDVPRRGPGYLDLRRADAALREAATLWIADNVEVYEGDLRVGYPKLVDARVTLPSRATTQK